MPTPLLVLLVFGGMLAGTLTDKESIKRETATQPITAYTDSLATIASIAFTNTPTPSVRFQWSDSSIVFVSANKHECRLILGDSLRWEGELEPTEAAKIFFWAVGMIYNESYRQEWQRIMYLQNYLDRYSSELEGKYKKAFELWLQQERIDG